MQIIKNSRTIAKTISWRVTATITTAVLVYLFTGKLDMALKIGFLEVFLKMAFYYIHERAWNSISYGKVEIKPVVLWFTGLSGSGKSTIAREVEKELAKMKFKVERLDGDRIRSVFPKTGFSREDRERHVHRVGFLASMLEKNGIFVVASLVSPYKDSRNFVRDLCENYCEVFVSTPLEVCEQRDVKGLYAKARKGEIKNFTGIDDPYEAPENAEIVIDTSKVSVEDGVKQVVTYVKNNIKRS
ncbi:adenylyl-sulfate kinase [bacterium]|nr:adenylyl-sulfate kinase [bacterium]